MLILMIRLNYLTILVLIHAVIKIGPLKYDRPFYLFLITIDFFHCNPIPFLNVIVFRIDFRSHHLILFLERPSFLGNYFFARLG